MSDTIRVLQVYPQLNNAGTEKVILNLYNNIDRNKVQFDFLCERTGELDESIKKMGGRIFYLYDASKRKYYESLLEFFRSHPEYHIIHTHTNARMGIVLKAAKRCKIPCRIAHSHNARNDLPHIAGFFKGLKSIPIERNASFFFACSSNAAKWLFPHRVKQCEILYNGINLQNYLFDAQARQEKRNELKIGNEETVIIHVGRFARQKNHEFLVRIASEFGRTHSKWKLLLVGTGPLQESIMRQVADNGIKEHVLFLGNRMDVAQLLSASDLFLFPSFHEGLGIVVIEAQASALPCIVSSAVPDEADMGVGLLKRHLLKEPVFSWVEAMNSNLCVGTDRSSLRQSILESNYNIQMIGNHMQQFYTENDLKAGEKEL